MAYGSYTDYLEMLAAQPQDKLALVDDAASFTYGQLVAEAKKLRSSTTMDEPAVFIHEDTIAQQLLKFVAFSGTAMRPIIATELSKKQQFELGHIPERACMGVMTSGSTGKSKLLWRDYHSWADFFPEQNRIFGVDEQTIIFCQGSLAFTGNLNIYMGVLAVGGTLIVTEKFRPKHWLQLMHQYDVNTLYLIPSKLMLLPKFMSAANESVRYIISGSQTMGRQEADKLLAVFPNTEITLYYGASELNYITYIKDKDMTEDRTVIGRPFKGVGITIQEEEIFIDTPYHVEEIAMPFSLKDRGYVDENGWLHFLGRTDDICNVNGRKVSSVKVTTALTDLPDIVEAGVLAKHEGEADVLVAYVATTASYSKQELLKLLRETLEDYELPKQFVFLEHLPRNESGKIDKLALGKWEL